MSFKLLAIRPLEGCNPKFLKNLEENRIYQFYNEYEFFIGDTNITHEKDSIKGEITKIIHTPTVPDNLYGDKINISAIVGKNGSGKSSLVELMYATLFSFSKETGLINDEKFIEEHELNEEQTQEYRGNLKHFETLYCEIFYITGTDKKLNILRKNENYFILLKEIEFSIETYDIKTIASENRIDLKKCCENDGIKGGILKDFFYSIVSNYSLYGLNTLENGIWLKAIFHKNDGYQTPIVIDPMRTDGKIDINNFTQLSKMRLLSNILKPLEKEQKEEDSLRNLINKKIAYLIELKINLKKFKIITPDEKIDKNYITRINDKDIHLEYSQKYKTSFFKSLYNSFANTPTEKITNLKVLNDDQLSLLTVEYILRKAFSLTKYPEFKKFIDFKNKNEEYVKTYFDELSKDSTHATFKLRQAMNFLKYRLFEIKNFECKVLVKTLSRKIENKIKLIKNEYNKTANQLEDIHITYDKITHKFDLIYFIPPSFFEVDITFEKEGSFNYLSSGEKQMVLSLSNVTYHLNNLKSVIQIEESKKYYYFNIIFDEIELCFHPQFQKSFIKNLISRIKNIEHIDSFLKGINIIFLTHSPFILSDIPNKNILYLKEGKNLNAKGKPEKSFGANITDLLADSFFIEDGLIGDFAKEKIKETIAWLNKILDLKNETTRLDNQEDSGKLNLINRKIEKLKKSEIHSTKQNRLYKYHYKLIQLIDEPLMKYKLAEMYNEAIMDFSKAELLERKIEEMQKELDLIKKGDKDA